MAQSVDIIGTLRQRFPEAGLAVQATRDGIPTVWVDAARVKPVLRCLQAEIDRPFRTLFDLTAIDERVRAPRDGQPAGDYTVVYHLLSHERNADVRVKVPLGEASPALESVTDLWPAADWYEREMWDMFGVTPDGHPRLRRILLPPWWEGHPLRKDHPARATEMGPFTLTDERQKQLEDSMAFVPDAWGMACAPGDFECLFLNLGPHHPGMHGAFRVVVQLNGQEIVNLACDIGFHHRGAEKMGERQSWHTYIPYTDRVDYLGGVLNNFPYVLAVERLAGIEAPPRARTIRVMMAELFRVISHLVFLGTFAQDLGMMSPVFYLFTDRERALDIVEAVTGARMHPGWFRIGGVAQDLPEGWEAMVRDFIAYLHPRLDNYRKTILNNRIFRERTVGVGPLSLDDALAWGASGPMLRGSGLAWDLRKQRPYGGYEEFDFDVPVGEHGDSFDRGLVHLEEMRQSLRIMEQCLARMPDGPYKAEHPLATPPPKPRTLRDIETLIDHFVNVSWGPVIPAGEACITTESSKGATGYYLVSDGGTMSYRTRIRTPSFAHIQMVPWLCRGMSIPDLIALLGSIDFVLADVDR